MAKTSKVVTEYIAQVDVSSDKTGKQFHPGDTVTSDDFPVKVIENWLGLGVLVEKEADADG